MAKELLPDCMMPDGAEPCLSYQDLCRQLEKALAERDELAEACREFVRKVECGEARSNRSYAQMEKALANLEADSYE